MQRDDDQCHGLTQGVRSSADQLESESARPLAAKADIRAVFVGKDFLLLSAENNYRIGRLSLDDLYLNRLLFCIDNVLQFHEDKIPQ